MQGGRLTACGGGDGTQVYSLGEQNRFYKKAAAFVLRAVAKHSPPLAQVNNARALG